MIRLEREIVVETFDAQATVAVGHDRPELLSVARLAADLGPVTGTLVSAELLGGLPEHVGWLVVDRCVGIGLLERTGERGPARISETGAKALELGTVLVPEESVWRFYLAATDPLLDDTLLHVVRLPIEKRDVRTERDELRKARAERRPRPTGDQRPVALKNAGEAVRLSVSTNQPFSVREVATQGTRGPGARLRLILESREESRPSVTLLGTLPGSGPDVPGFRVDRVPAEPRALGTVDYDALWAAAAGAASGVAAGKLAQWRERVGERCVPVGFDETDDAARRALRKVLKIPAGDLLGLGPFNASLIEQVTVVPKTSTDAQSWCDWLLRDSIRDYATPTRIGEIGKAVLARFPAHSPRLPEPDELLHDARRNPYAPGARFLLAPADLGLWR